MRGSSELEKLSSGDGMCKRAIKSTSMSADLTSNAVEAVINAAVCRHQTLKTGQSNIE